MSHHNPNIETVTPRRHRAGAVVTASLIAASVLLPAATAAAAPAGCAAIDIVMVPGTGETDPGANPTEPRGMLRGVTDPLQQQFGAAVGVTYVPYEASAFNKGKTYADSKATGVSWTARHVQQRAAECPNTRFVLGGYSQGADVAGDIAWLIGHGKLAGVEPSRVLAVGLLADPRRDAGDGTTVGPQLDGSGLAGHRPDGFGQLTPVTRSYCDNGDLYCSNPDSNGIIAGLGRTLSSPATALTSTQQPGATTGPADLQTSLVADYSKVDLPGLAQNLQSMQDQVGSGTVDPAALGSTVAAITNTIVPLADTSQWVAKNPTVAASLEQAAPDSPEHAANQVVQKVNGADLSGALQAASTIINTLQNGGGASQAQTLQAPSDTLSAQLTPLAMTPADGLSLAANALSILKPSVLIDQVKTIATTSFALAGNVPEMIDIFFNRIPRIIVDLTDIPTKIRALHTEFDRLNVLFEPVVLLAAGLDYQTAAGLISLIPDPTGTGQVISMIVGILGNLDIIGLARTAGELQKQLWHALETGDIIGSALGALPQIGEFARIALGTLTGGSKTDPAMLGKASPAGQSGQQITLQAQAGDFPALASSLTNLASSSGADAIAQLGSEALKAAAFYSSDAHTLAYTRNPVNGAGDSALVDMTNHFRAQISQVAA